jgi:hypothetical protein
MSELPFGGFKASELGGDRIGDALKRVEEVSVDGSRGFSWPKKAGITLLARYVISKVEIKSIRRAKHVTIPIKRWRSDFPVDLEELIYLFPS